MSKSKATPKPAAKAEPKPAPPAKPAKAKQPTAAQREAEAVEQIRTYKRGISSN